MSWPRCELCGARLGRDESQLTHEFSGRCGGHAPPPKHTVKKDKRGEEE